MSRIFKTRTGKKLLTKDEKTALVLIGPMIFWWCIVSGLPVIFGVVLGFLDWKGFSKPPSFAAFNNFIFFFKNPIYYKSLWRSVWMGAGATFITVMISFLLAIMMTSIPKLRGLFRTLWYIPAVTSVAVITQIFLLLLDPDKGVINNFLTDMGLSAINVRESLPAAIATIFIYTIWKGAGGGTLLWIAGLQSVDKNLYEAAAIDGAGRISKFRFITLPALKPFITYAVITGAINSVQIYEQVAFISGGGPLGQTQTTTFLIMADTFTDFNFGMAGASSLIVTLVVFVFVFLYWRKQGDVFKTGGGI